MTISIQYLMLFLFNKNLERNLVTVRAVRQYRWICSFLNPANSFLLVFYTGGEEKNKGRWDDHI